MLDWLRSKLARAVGTTRAVDKTPAESERASAKVGTNRSNARDLLDKGTLALSQRRQDEALRWLREAVRDDPLLAEAHFHLGNLT
jgi:hypothetical protein